MSHGTEALLRAVLLQSKLLDNAEDIRTAIEAMCTEDTIAYVEKKVAEIKARKIEK